ncbi:MAG: FAD-dependent oxidoreductase [Intestinimonas sp.]|jgi:thioredoxin reductase/NAD-dependent dihydropyrimidine dehydrogenase PreA subunit|nr:FAD-dependent oxidoreductase [Intestinimonas sp.]
MERYDLVVVGAGPSGLSAAIEAAKCGLTVVVFDENSRPGGQLFKQIHKFFGSKEHNAKIRGFRIGENLLKEASACGVKVILNATVIGLFRQREVTVRIGNEIVHVKGDAILIATGASENMVPFPGWTLPGVIGAGAAQTMMNLHHIKPGKRILMLGTGNVGLVVSYQLLQAGCELAALVDAAPRVGGYGVHAAKVARCSVPFYLSHTIVRAEGEEFVTGVVIAEVDHSFKPIPGTEKHFEVDTICLAVGLSPMSQLCKMAGCEMTQAPTGYAPVCDKTGQTSLPGVYVAGDVSGIEEASSAMIEGRIAGAAVAERLGFLGAAERDERLKQYEAALSSLRKGMFAPENRGKAPKKTEEGLPISMNLLQKGYMDEAELEAYPGMIHMPGLHPVIECTQNIPCNPCQDACPRGCIKIGADLTALPSVDVSKSCSGCGMCVASCSGQAIFLVNEDVGEGFAEVTMPYEFLPLPRPGERGMALDRSGTPVCPCEVVSLRSAPAFDQTNLLTIRVPAQMAGRARQYRVGGAV